MSNQGHWDIPQNEGIPFTIYPTHQHNRLLLVVSTNNPAEVRIKLLNMQEQTVMQAGLDNRGLVELDVEDLSPGVYWLYLSTPHQRTLSKLIRQPRPQVAEVSVA